MPPTFTPGILAHWTFIHRISLPIGHMHTGLLPSEVLATVLLSAGFLKIPGGKSPSAKKSYLLLIGVPNSDSLEIEFVASDHKPRFCQGFEDESPDLFTVGMKDFSVSWQA